MIEQFRSLSTKIRFRLLVIGFMLTGWVLYQVAIAKTVELVSECNALQNETDSAATIPFRYTELQAELQHLNEFVSDSNFNISHEELLNVVSVYCNENNLRILAFTEPLVYTRNEWEIETHPVIVEGTYTGIVRFLDFLYRNHYGSLVSADFQAKTDNRSKVRSLQVTVYIQNIKNSKL